jgi:hypothetical protein
VGKVGAYRPVRGQGLDCPRRALVLERLFSLGSAGAQHGPRIWAVVTGLQVDIVVGLITVGGQTVYNLTKPISSPSP